MTAAALLMALVAVARVVVLERRLLLVARADHELRGPLTSLLMAVERGVPVDTELARVRLGLADLAEARRGRRAAPQRAPVSVAALARRAAAGRATVD